MVHAGEATWMTKPERGKVVLWKWDGRRREIGECRRVRQGGKGGREGE